MQIPPTEQASSSDKSEDDNQIRVMLVDDSSIIRGMIARGIEDDPVIKVTATAANGEQAVTSIGRARPDIVLLDIEMPVMDGLTALPKLLQLSPSSKIIMCSTLTEKGAKVTMEALRLGAIETICKPTSTREMGGADDFIAHLKRLVKNIGSAAVTRRTGKNPYLSRSVSGPASGTGATAPRPSDTTLAAMGASGEPGTYHLRKDPGVYKGKPAIIAIGSSTGGPQALFEVTKHFKGLDIPIVITQHMPATFTRILAQHIQQQSGIPSHEGEEGMPVRPGEIYVAPGGKHMEIRQKNGQNIIRLNEGPLENFCRPSVDPMVRSVVKIFGKRVLGVILTGMGHDGLPGMKELVEQGGRLIAQDEKSSVVWGMPGAVATAGLCSEVLPLADIGPWVKKAAL